jgi:glycosyltransferase involved in cell wall biosynthesis
MFVSRGYPTDDYKTLGIFEFDQAKAIAALGHKVIFVSLDLRSFRRKRKWGYEKFEKDNVSVYGMNIPLGNVPDKILSFFYEWSLKKLYRKIVREQGDVAVMHAHFPDLSYAAAKLKEQEQLPLIVTEHSSQINKSVIEKNVFRKAQFAYDHADAVIAVSPSLAKVIKEKFSIDALHIPNIVDTETFRYEPQTAPNASSFRFVSTGRLLQLKRMDMTISAFGKAFKGKEDVYLKIFGEGPERDALQKLIQELGLEKQVVLAGVKSRNDIAEELNKSDCFVLASQSETFGVAYIEALATGTPVIATKCGGPETFITADNGILVNVDDEQGLEKSMVYMYADRERYIPAAISEETIKLFGPANVASQIVEVYKKHERLADTGGAS